MSVSGAGLEAFAVDAVVQDFHPIGVEALGDVVVACCVRDGNEFAVAVEVMDGRLAEADDVSQMSRADQAVC